MLDINELIRLAKANGAEFNLRFTHDYVEIKVEKYDWRILTALNYELMAEYNNDITWLISYKVKEMIKEIEDEERKETKNAD